MREPEVILPRELTDIGDEVRRVPPPPMPEVPAPYAFRLADPDADLLRSRFPGVRLTAFYPTTDAGALGAAPACPAKHRAAK